MIGWILGGLAALLLAEGIRNRYTLQVNTQTVALPRLGEGWSDTRICHVSDIHTATTLRSGKLLRKILQTAPDAVFLSGDFLEGERKKENRYVFDLIRALREKNIPVYCSMGNHEARIQNGSLPEGLKAELLKSGGIFLDNSGISVERRGEKCYIYGYLQPLIPRKNMHFSRLRLDITAEEITKALGNRPTDAPVLLLAHDPCIFSAYAEWGADLTFSGHIHGGIVRLPKIGGVLSPNRRFAPKYDAGLYAENGSRLFVSRGVDNRGIPRLFNPPEITLLILKNKKS